MGQSIFSKIWNKHLLAEEGGLALIYIDRHLTHEVTSPIAFESLRKAKRVVRRPDLTFAVTDHNVPTTDRSLPVIDELSRRQILELVKNCEEFGITCFDYTSPLQGIVHVIGPELGLTIPGITIACGDSHTSTHGAFGTVAFGIGTSEGEHVFATQTLWVRRPNEMKITINGSLSRGVTAKDVILHIIREIGVGGAIGHVIEYDGETVKNMSMEERMTIANMSTEAGARTAIISPDDKTYQYIKDSLYAPKGEDWDRAMKYWSTLPSDHNAHYERKVSFDVSKLPPQVTWGTNPSMTSGIDEEVPSPEAFPTERRELVERAIRYMGLRPGQKIMDIEVDVVFIGSCTNARLSDLIQAAMVVRGKKVNSSVRAIVVPGSQQVKMNAERIGLDKVFKDAGFEWRNSGCSMCIAMNGDRLFPGQRCASTSNRNFENRQGPGGRTHLVSPMMAAAAAIEGRFTDVRNLELASLDEMLVS